MVVNAKSAEKPVTKTISGICARASVLFAVKRVRYSTNGTVASVQNAEQLVMKTINGIAVNAAFVAR
jgi:hypothetical protein